MFEELLGCFKIYEDGELTALQVNNKVLDNVFYTGDWILVRKVER